MGAFGRGNRLGALSSAEGTREGRVEGRYAYTLCTLPDLIKGLSATDGWLFARDFVKDFSVLDGPCRARSRRHRRLLVFLSLSEGTPADLLPIVPLLIDRNFISITSYFGRNPSSSFGSLAATSPSLACVCVLVQSN